MSLNPAQMECTEPAIACAARLGEASGWSAVAPPSPTQLLTSRVFATRVTTGYRSLHCMHDNKNILVPARPCQHQPPREHSGTKSRKAGNGIITLQTKQSSRTPDRRLGGKRTALQKGSLQD